MNMKIRINIANFHFDHDRHILFEFFIRSLFHSLLFTSRQLKIFIYICARDAFMKTFDVNAMQIDKLKYKSTEHNQYIKYTFRTQNARIFPSASFHSFGRRRRHRFFVSLRIYYFCCLKI